MSVLTLTLPACLVPFTGFGDSSVMPKVTEGVEVIKESHLYQQIPPQSITLIPYYRGAKLLKENDDEKKIPTIYF